MGIVTGYICLACMLLLLVKHLSRRFRWERVNKLLMKIHKYTAFAFLLVGIIHFVLVFPVLKSRSSVIVVSGIAAVAAGLGILLFCHTMRDRRKELHLHRSLSALLLCMGIVHIVFYYADYHQYRTAIEQISVEEVDLTLMPDGSYVGDFDAGYIYAKVQVTVQAHQLRRIEVLEHRNERGSGAEILPDAMVTGQRIKVDAVSGATNSSLVIEKACENALRKGAE